MVCAGIDNSKRKLDAAIERPEALTVDNDSDGHAALSLWLRRRRVKRVEIDRAAAPYRCIGTVKTSLAASSIVRTRGRIRYLRKADGRDALYFVTSPISGETRRADRSRSNRPWLGRARIASARKAFGRARGDRLAAWGNTGC
jgi:hypothetical protein